MKEGNLPVDDIINYITFQNVFIRQQVDELYSRKDVRDQKDISKRDIKNFENIIKIYNKINKFISEKIDIEKTS